MWNCSADCSSLHALHVQRCGFTHELILSEGISLSVSQYHFLYCLFILWEAQALIAGIALLSLLDFPFDAGTALVGGLSPEHFPLAMASLIQVLTLVAVVDALLLPALSLVVVIRELS